MGNRLANYSLDRGLLSRMHKKTKKINSHKTNDPLMNWRWEGRSHGNGKRQENGRGSDSKND